MIAEYDAKVLQSNKSSTSNIYGKHARILELVLADFITKLKSCGKGKMVYEHLLYRIKSPDSMAEKCRRKDLPQTAYSALYYIHDAIGVRIVCHFIDEVYQNVQFIKSLPGIHIIEEKDYIKNVKPNGYRSYHMIVEFAAPYEDVSGNKPGHFFAEIQLRTIAMDSWASLEHEMKYKHDIKNPELIIRELKRCADELAACDISMQTIRNLIHMENNFGKWTTK